jgi:hypothetical protein
LKIKPEIIQNTTGKSIAHIAILYVNGILIRTEVELFHDDYLTIGEAGIQLQVI